MHLSLNVGCTQLLKWLKQYVVCVEQGADLFHTMISHCSAVVQLKCAMPELPGWPIARTHLMWPYAAAEQPAGSWLNLAPCFAVLLAMHMCTQQCEAHPHLAALRDKAKLKAHAAAILQIRPDNPLALFNIADADDTYSPTVVRYVQHCAQQWLGHDEEQASNCLPLCYTLNDTLFVCTSVLYLVSNYALYTTPAAA
jgi:hypothetical protein